MHRILLYLALCVLLPLATHAKPLMSDISTNRIEIHSAFTGAELLLFGARNDIGDIVVVVRGPEKNYIVRKKERVAGVWANRSQQRFRALPDYYAVASSKPLEQLKINPLYAQLDIRPQQLIKDELPEEALEFADAFERHQQSKQVYSSEVGEISFMGETLFKTPLFFPDNTPDGIYTAEVYLFNNGELVSVDSTPIRVIKTGFDAYVHNLAHNSPAIYGIIAILIALSMGWAAGAIFEKL